MDYEQANAQLTGRCYASRKLGNNTYLQRRGDSIAVLLHSTDVITFHPNGDIELNSGGWNTVTTKDRINQFQPYRVYSERGQMFLQINSRESGKKYVFEDGITISRDGKVVGAGDLEEVIEGWREEDREASRVSRWLSKARGMKRIKVCGKRHWECEALTGRRGFGKRLAGVGEFECGCVVERVQHKTKLTVPEIMAESNISVRMAMIHVYGFERFMVDANPMVIDTHGEYSLLDLPLNTWRTMRALKMTCPSTGAVYISPVDPSVRNVSDALDWYFQTTDYLKSVTQQS